MSHDGPPTGLAIEVSNTQNHLPLDPAELVRLARRVLHAQGVTRAAISLAVVDDPTLHRINRLYLQHDWPTDVVTFPLSDPDDPVLAAEIVLSAEMAATTAREHHADPHHELALYLVHGLLHLCGYDDLQPDDRARMRARESEILHSLGLPASTFRLPPSPQQEAPSCPP
jgi:probable rRNA maturation factor